MAEIWAEIAANASEEIATRFVVSVEAAFEPIRHFPLAAPLRSQIAADLRVAFHSPYAIYYRTLGDAVVIIRVLHGARDVEAIAGQGGFSE